jgi:hypothetical protein
VAEIYNTWTNKTTAKVKEAFNRLRLTEIYIFKGDKSYFRSLENRGVISEDNRDFLNTSDKQEDKD